MTAPGHAAGRERGGNGYESSGSPAPDAHTGSKCSWSAKAVGCGEFGRVSRDGLVLDRGRQSVKGFPPAGRSASPGWAARSESFTGGQAEEFCGLALLSLSWDHRPTM